MGTLTSGLTTLLPVLQTAAGLANGIGTIAKQEKDQERALSQLQSRQAETLRQSQEDVNLQKKQIQINSDEAQKQRSKALKRAVARQRTLFGSQGISADGGSGQAILLGLFDENEDDRLQAERLDTLRTNALDQTINQKKRLNILQASQLAEKQRVGRLF